MAVWTGEENGKLIDRVFFVVGGSASWKLDENGSNHDNYLWSYYQEFQDPNQTPVGGWQEVKGGKPEEQLNMMKAWRAEFPNH